MPWVKLDDRLHLNLKLAGVSSNAFRLYIHSLTYSAANGSDGHIQERALPLVWPAATARLRKKAAEELVKAGCWTLNGDGWSIHDYLAYNPSARGDRGRQQSDAGTYANHIRWHRNRGVTDPACQWCPSDSDQLSETESEPDPKRNPNGIRNHPPDPDPDPDPGSTNAHAEGLTTPREALRAWAILQDTRPTEPWIKIRLTKAEAFLEQHPDLSRTELTTFLKWARNNGCAEPGGWPSWWPAWPKQPAAKEIPHCEICDDRRLVPLDDDWKMMAPCVCIQVNR